MSDYSFATRRTSTHPRRADAAKPEPRGRSLGEIENDRKRLAELRAIEARLAGTDGPVSFHDDYEALASGRLELAAIREVIAAVPPDVEPQFTPPPSLTPEEQERCARVSLISDLRATVKDCRSRLPLLRQSLESTKAKLNGPVDMRGYVAPRISPSMNSDAAQALINRAYAQHCERFHAPLRAGVEDLRAEIEGCEREAAAAEEELRDMEAEAEG
jgi:hypothetical protein